MNAALVILASIAGVAVVAAVLMLVWVRRTTAELRRQAATAVGDRDEAVRRSTDAEARVAWLLSALDESPDAVLIVDHLGREVARNAAARRLAGARTGEALADDALGEMLAAALAGDVAERELRLYGPSRQVLQVSSFPLRRDGEVVGAVGFTRDVTEARRIEDVRRDFVANVSHELKTPIGALALLAETIASSDDPVVTRRLAERVVHESERLASIVDDLLDLTAIEAREVPAQEPVPVRRLIADAVEFVRAAAELAGVPLRVAPELPEAEVVCDPRQMRSALVNLIDNAVKYSEPGALVEVGARAEPGRVVITVADHGIGIPTRDLERIFERFYRVDRARSRDTGGTGLGLSIVRHVVQAHGGSVTVDSREGEGSVFAIDLPVVQDRARPLPEAS